MKPMKPGDMFNAFQSKKRKAMETKKKNGFAPVARAEAEPKKKTKKKSLRSPEAVVKSEQNASHQFNKKHKKMTQAQDDAYDTKHGIKEGSKRDIAQDKREGIKDKKHMKTKCKKHMKTMCKVCAKKK